jgi:hypothetical protein
MTRPVNHFYDENYRQDNPGMRRVVWNADEFVAMLERRGYRLVHDDDFYAVVHGDQRTLIAEEFFKYQTIAEIARQLDYLVGMHHVWCGQCKEPLLRHKDYAVLPGEIIFQDRGWPIEFGDPESMAYFEYRSAKAGPHSPVIASCVTCNAVLKKHIEEITDVEN